jgi:hypothetical protein
VFEVVPHQLVGVELGRVRRQTLDVQAGMAREPAVTAGPPWMALPSQSTMMAPARWLAKAVTLSYQISLGACDGSSSPAFSDHAQRSRL